MAHVQYMYTVDLYKFEYSCLYCNKTKDDQDIN